MDELTALRGILSELGAVVVAFSGGADSSFLAWVARDTLGRDAVHAVTAVSASLPSEEREHCARLAADWDLRWTEVDTDELMRDAYRRNDGDRCFHCKSALMDRLEPLARREAATVVLGVNVDDLGEHRPGQAAAAGRGARFPLVEAGLTKAEVRAMSRRAGLRTWDKPAAACLASRVPYGTEVTVAVLGRVERAEAGLRRLGFAELRVRHYGDHARLELPLAALGHAVERREEVVGAVKAAGYRYVTLDLEGLRSGNLNQALIGAGPGPGPVPGAAAVSRAADEAAFRAYGEALVAEVESRVVGWLAGSIVERWEAWYAAPAPEEVRRAAGDCARRTRQALVPELASLVAADVDDQRTTPLELMRRCTAGATDLLAPLRVPPLDRDEVATRLDPGDLYGLAPAAWADVDPALTEPGLVWGAAKAAVILARRRDEGRR